MKKNSFYFVAACFLFLSFMFFPSAKEANATENDYLVNVYLLNIDYEPVTEALEGQLGYLNLTLTTAKQLHSGDQLALTLPNEITLSQNRTYKIVDSDGQEVGNVQLNDNLLTLSFTTDIEVNSSLKINNISYSFSPVEQTKEFVLNFGNNITKKIVVNDVGDGNFNWLPSPTLSTIDDVAYWTEHVPLTNYRVIPAQDILKDSPNYQGAAISYQYKYAPYYFFGHNKLENYLPAYFAVCIDLFHTIALYQNVPLMYSSLTDYIEPEAVYKINLYMQFATMLAEENGMVINEDGKNLPIEFTNDEQQAYMFTGQYLGWMQSLMYNKNPDYRINNVTTDTLKPISPSGSEVDLSKYITDIFQTVDNYNNLDYIANDSINVKLNQSKNIISIPKEQQKFIHSIDKESSENLDLIKGLTESDFEDFNELNITPTQKFGDKQVKIVIQKKPNSFWNNVFNNTGLTYSNSSAQYKSIVGLLNSEIKTTTITLNMENTKEITVTKIWDDSNNQDGKRPNNIEVELYADNNPTGKKELLNEQNQWKYTWTDLDEKKDGNSITYTVKEVTPISDYESSVTNDAQGNFILTNSYQPETTFISGTKTWDDKEDQDGKRPKSIVVHLLSNGENIASQTITEATNWQYEFNDLPKYSDGKLIDYTVIEDVVDQYVPLYDDTNITNRYTLGKTSLTVVKVWNDSNNQNGKRPTSVEVELYADNEPTGKKELLSEQNHWRYTWIDLDEKKTEK